MLTGLLAGLLATLGLAAAPVSDLGAAIAGGDGDPPAERAVRTVTVGTPTLTEQTAHQHLAASAPGGEGDVEDADTAAGTDAGQPADGATRGVWDRLADCESGDWDEHGEPRPGTARWDYGLDFAHAGYEQFQGGLNFHPGTWDAFRESGMPDHAGHASRAQQIVVAERVLDAQGWSAWPVCSRMLGLR